jgi:hypothetical protein
MAAATAAAAKVLSDAMAPTLNLTGSPPLSFTTP